MGRRTHKGELDEEECRMRLRNVPLDSGGYDRGGAYWGLGDPLYCCVSPCENCWWYLRAKHRDDAIAQVLEYYPKVKFYGKDNVRRQHSGE